MLLETNNTDVIVTLRLKGKKESHLERQRYPYQTMVTKREKTEKTHSGALFSFSSVVCGSHSPNSNGARGQGSSQDFNH